MKRFKFLCLLLLFQHFALHSQTYQISGVVRDAEGNGLPFANVFLLSASDSTEVKGNSANEEGNFMLSEVVPGLYLLKATYFGAESSPRALDISKNVNIGALVISDSATNLDEVTLIAKQPTLERKPDRIVFNVENTVVSQSSSWDIIRNTPGVINSQEGLQIRGKTATVYLNDRKIQLSEEEIQALLEGFAGQNIKSVEVIPNPPARYEAEGGPIINITTSKNITPGYKGSLNGTYTQAILPKYSVGTSHYFKTDKLSLFANYSFNPRRERKTTDSDINFIDETSANFARWDIDLKKTTKSQAQNANVILDYEFDKRNTLNFTTNLAFSPNKEISNGVLTEMRNGQGQLDSTLTTTSGVQIEDSNLAFDFTYVHRFKKEGSLLSANAHYTRYKQDQIQDVMSRYTDATGNFLNGIDFSTDSDQQIDIYTGQIDFFSPLGDLTLESGARISNIISANTYDFFDIEGGQSTPNMALSDNFEYDELVYAGYMSLLKNWEKWSVKAGLRAEQTEVEGNSLSLNSTNTQNYLEFFPSLYILHNVNEENSISFDYSRKLQRPNYQDLNPFRYFLNENDFNEGNPNLRPNFSHNFNLNYTLKDTYFFDIYYRDNGEYISTLSFQDNTAQTLRQVNQNVSESISYGLDFTISASLMDFWYLYAYTSVFYESETFVALESDDQMYLNEVEGFYGSINNYLTLSNDGTWTGELSFAYLSTFIFGSYVQSDPTAVLNLGLRKSLWDNRAIISFAAEDILGKANPRYTSRYLNQDNSYRPLPETQLVRIGFTYNFGNFRLTDNQKEIDKKERDRIEAEQ